MAHPWNNWFHVVGSTSGAWLRGDPRGWRARKHREHVVGDYKHPPAPGFYDSRHGYSKFIMKREAVVLDAHQRLCAATALARSLIDHNVELIDLCVSAMHFHGLCRFDPPGSGNSDESALFRRAKHLIGIAKKDSARVLSSSGLVIPGGIWAVRGKFKGVRDRGHQVRVARYIRAHYKQGAVVYSVHLRGR